MASPITKKQTKNKTQQSPPWNVIILDDPVNLMQYVTMVLKKVFGYSEGRAKSLMMEVHTRGQSIVWSGAREKAEFYVQQLHGWQLKSTMEQSS